MLVQAVNDTRDSLTDERDVEVDKQAEALVGEPKVGQKLLLVNRGDQFHGFDLHNDFVFDNEVGFEGKIDADIVVDSGDFLLSGRSESPPLEFMAKNCCVNRFEQSGSKRCVNFISRVDDLF